MTDTDKLEGGHACVALQPWLGMRCAWCGREPFKMVVEKENADKLVQDVLHDMEEPIEGSITSEEEEAVVEAIRSRPIQALIEKANRAERLEEALKKWPCSLCDGMGPERGGCDFCGGTGLHPIASEALSRYRGD